MKQSDFASRLSQALEARGLKAADLSKKTKVAEGTISCYINGRYEAKQNRVKVFAEALDVNPAWLMGYDVPMDAEHPNLHLASSIPPGFIPMPQMHKVPLVGSIACGTPILAEQNIDGNVDAPEDIRCDFALRCKGDSMIDAGIHDGDAVYIRIQPEVENGEIAAVRIGEEATLKRVYYDGTTLTLMPANAAFAPMVFTGPQLEEVHIEGRVVGWTHWVG